MVGPIRRGAAGPECILQAAVETFDHPVGLRMVGGGLVVLDIEEAAEGGPQVVMSNQRFFKIVCFRFPTNVPKKIEHIRF